MDDRDASKLRALLDSHLARKGLEGLEPKAALQIIGELVDLGGDFADPRGPRKALELAETLSGGVLQTSLRPMLPYFEANAWLTLDQLERRGSHEDLWAWDRLEYENAFVCLRRATLESGFAEIEPVFRCRILTNLANTFDTVGRFVASSATYARAAEAEPEFGMPRVNRGISLWHYACAHYDQGHRGILLWHANREIAEGMKRPLESGAEHGAAQFLKTFRQAASSEYLESPLDLDEYPLGDADEEIEYRRWCLAHRLFLNSLNDCFEHSVAATDVLHLPSMVMPRDHGPGLHGFFNQMKQEYVSARYALYRAHLSRDAHFSDKHVKLLNTWDYAVYGLGFEGARTAYRASAALLDKAAVFLAKYLELADSNRASFVNIWYQKGKVNKGLRPELRALENWPLRGLFWLSKDLYDTAVSRQLLDPEGARLKQIRNHLEHGYVKVIDPMGERQLPAGMADEHALIVPRGEFMQMAHRYLGHAREALIYLSLGVHADQRRRGRHHGPGAVVPPVALDDIDDDWKT